MATYKSFKQLNGKTLKQNDVLVFDKYKYNVHSDFLNNPELTNDVLFDHFGIDAIEFCEAAYGYKSKSGFWPECKHNDFEALTRVALLIFFMLEDKEATGIAFVEAGITIGGAKYDSIKISGKPYTASVMVGDYKAIITKKYVKVGCQQIPYGQINNLVKHAKKLGFIK